MVLKTPSPSAHAATSPRGRGYIIFLYLSVGAIHKSPASFSINYGRLIASPTTHNVIYP